MKKRSETLTAEEAVEWTARALGVSKEEASELLGEATLKGSLPIYEELDDGALRRLSVEELQKELDEK